MRYLVTGCAGFIGSHLCHELLENNHEVIGVDSLNSYYSVKIKKSNLENLKRFGERFTFYEMDVNAIEKSIFSKIDGVFHLAAQAGVRSSWGSNFSEYVKNNLLATQKIFDYTKDGLPVIYASSSSVYGNSNHYPVIEDDVMSPRSPYGVTKAGGDLLAQAYLNNFDSKLIGVRYFTVYGPRQRPDMAFTRICSSLLSNDVFPIYGTGQQIRDFTYVSDAVKATVLLMDQKVTGIFNIGGGEETTLLNAIGLFEGISGKKLNVTTEYSAKGDVEKTGASTLKLTQLTGWTPKFNMVSVIEAQWNWALKNKLAIIESVREFRDI